MHSKREMDLRKTTDLTNVLAELLSLAEQQICNLSLFRRFAGLRFFCSIKLILHRSLDLCCMALAAVRHDGPIRPESNLEWIQRVHSPSCRSQRLLGWAVAAGISV